MLLAWKAPLALPLKNDYAEEDLWILPPAKADFQASHPFPSVRGHAICDNLLTSPSSYSLQNLINPKASDPSPAMSLLGPYAGAEPASKDLV